MENKATIQDTTAEVIRLIAYCLLLAAFTSCTAQRKPIKAENYTMQYIARK